MSTAILTKKPNRTPQTNSGQNSKSVSSTKPKNGVRSRNGAKRAEADIFRSMLDRAPTPVMLCDENLVITYMNESSLAMLRQIEQYLPVTANDVIGQCIDIFHKDPSHQRHMLADAGIRLPLQTTISVGPERADLLVSAVTDSDGNYLGAMLTWELVTERLRLAAEAQETSANSSATSSVLERLSTANTADQAITLALDSVRESFGWAYGSFWRRDHKDDLLRFECESGSVNPEFRTCTENASFAKGVGLSGRTWQTMQMNFVPDIGEVTDCVRAPIAKRAGVKSGVCLPIIVENELIGTMDFFSLETVTLSTERSTAIRDIGNMVSTTIQRLSQASKAAAVQSMVQQAPLNIMMADTDLNITYLNDSSVRTLKTIEQYLPVTIDQMLGNSIDIFHKNPAHQRQLLANPANLPHTAKIQVGPETLELQVSAVYDDSGTYVGPMVAWTVVSERLKMYEALYVSLKEVTSTLSAAAAELSSSSTQMTDSARQTVHKTEEVAAATEQSERNLSAVAEATTGMSESVNDIARNVQEANGITQRAVSMAENTNTTIAKLDESSEQIGKVVKLITTIAQQTNLLALNATIEAARAGEAGKGFAVVANEVKELARKTATATDEISQQIESIQADTRQSVGAIKEITDIISQINQITVTVATATEEQSSATSDINRNIQEVANGTKDIARNIVSVTDVAKGSQDVASNLNESSEGLAKLAGDLQSLISKFEDVSED